MANVIITPQDNEIYQIKQKGSETQYYLKDDAARTALGNIQVSLDNNYTSTEKVLSLVSPAAGDNFQTAIAKLHTGLVADERILEVGLNDLDSRVDTKLSLSGGQMTGPIRFGSGGANSGAAIVLNSKPIIIDNYTTTDNTIRYLAQFNGTNSILLGNYKMYTKLLSWDGDLKHIISSNNQGNGTLTEYPILDTHNSGFTKTTDYGYTVKLGGTSQNLLGIGKLTPSLNLSGSTLSMSVGGETTSTSFANLLGGYTINSSSYNLGTITTEEFDEDLNEIVTNAEDDNSTIKYVINQGGSAKPTINNIKLDSNYLTARRVVKPGQTLSNEPSTFDIQISASSTLTNTLASKVSELLINITQQTNFTDEEILTSDGIIDGSHITAINKSYNEIKTFIQNNTSYSIKLKITSATLNNLDIELSLSDFIEVDEENYANIIFTADKYNGIYFCTASLMFTKTNNIYSLNTEESTFTLNYGITSLNSIIIQNHPDWNESDSTSLRYINNKPTNVSAFTNDANYATQSDVNTAVSNLVNSAPAALDTLNELAVALGNDANFATTITNQISAKYTKPSSGIPSSDLDSTVQANLELAASALQSAPVTSVNGQTGAVTVDVPVTSVDGMTGAVNLSSTYATITQVTNLDNHIDSEFESLAAILDVYNERITALETSLGDIETILQSI